MPVDSYYNNEALKLAAGPQLLLDDALVEDRINLRRVLHRPVKFHRNPVLLQDKPWEGSSAYRPQVIWDPEQGKYRMWYQCFSRQAYGGGDGSRAYYVGYAESDDGFVWHKPIMDDRPFGEYGTNIVYAGAHNGFSLGQAFRDETDPDPQRRYKMVGNDGRPHPRYPQNINTEPSIVCSGDGLTWKLTGERAMLDHHSDTANHLVHDPARNRWLLYCRPTVFASGRAGGEYGHPRRRVSVMTSADLVHWSYPRIIVYGDEGDLPDYDHCRVFRYGSHFLMLYAANDLGPMHFHTRLASSTDGIHWQRFHTREDFLPLGPEGAWDAGRVGPSCEPIAQGDHLLLYYLGGNIGQNEAFTARRMSTMASGVAVMRRDRFVAQRAEDKTGCLLTREFVLGGDTLKLNLLTAAGGRVRVEVLRHPPLGEHADYFLRENGYTFAYEGFGLDDCVPLRGDSTGAVVRWTDKSLAERRGRSVYLRFELRWADLFAFEVSNA